MTDDFDNGYDPYNSVTTRKTPPLPDWLQNWLDPQLVAELCKGVTLDEFIMDDCIVVVTPAEVREALLAMNKPIKWAPVLDTRAIHDFDPNRYRKG